MMISDKMAARLNEQVKHEFNSYYIYLAMAYKFVDMNLPIFAKWFFLQADEEKEHAMKIAHYLTDQGASVKLAALDMPKNDYGSALEICEAALAHEIKITKLINEIADLAVKESDHATRKFNDWFVEEQVEEVASVDEVTELVRMAQTPGQLLQLEGRLVHLREGLK